MAQDLPSYLVTLNFIFRTAAPILLVAGIWLAVGRSKIPPAQHLTTRLVISAAVLGWFAVAWTLGSADVFVITADEFPRIQFAIVTPIVLSLILMLASARGRAVTAATPQTWLVAMQTYRLLGGMFLILWAQGKMPGEFAIPAGTGDVIIGLTAPFVAWLNYKGSPRAEAVTRAWNVLGIMDLVVALTTGFLTSPSPIQLLAFDRPNLLITTYPIVMVPIFLVPLSIILHGLSLWKIRRAAASPSCLGAPATANA